MLPFLICIAPLPFIKHKHRQMEVQCTSILRVFLSSAAEAAAAAARGAAKAATGAAAKPAAPGGTPKATGA